MKNTTTGLIDQPLIVSARTVTSPSNNTQATGKKSVLSNFGDIDVKCPSPTVSANEVRENTMSLTGGDKQLSLPTHSSSLSSLNAPTTCSIKSDPTSTSATQCMTGSHFAIYTRSATSFQVGFCYLLTSSNV